MYIYIYINIYMYIGVYWAYAGIMEKIMETTM